MKAITHEKLVAICTAYEQGFGTGLYSGGRSAPLAVGVIVEEFFNPYQNNTDESAAWDLGFEEGKHRNVTAD